MRKKHPWKRNETKEMSSRMWSPVARTIIRNILEFLQITATLRRGYRLPFRQSRPDQLLSVVYLEQGRRSLILRQTTIFDRNSVCLKNMYLYDICVRYRVSQRAFSSRERCRRVGSRSTTTKSFSSVSVEAGDSLV